MQGGAGAGLGRVEWGRLVSRKEIGRGLGLEHVGAGLGRGGWAEVG